MKKQNSNPESKFDIYAVITDRIISELEKGRIPWKQPWIAAKGGKNVAYSRSTGRAYSLLNQMMLGKPGEYLTFKQVQEAGGHVRKGEKSHMVVFWKQISVSEAQEDGTEKVKFIPYLKYYNVFHIDQCDGVKAKYDWDENKPDASFEPDAEAEKIVAEYLKRSGVKLIHEAGNRAFYRPSTDSVTIPEMEQFKDKAEYYSTLFHELTHSTGHSSRLARIEKTAAFGNEEYSREELVAEIGAAALNNQCGLETENSFKNSAAYIQSWLSVLRNDKRMIVVAAGKADKAVALINGEGQDDPAPAPDDKPEAPKADKPEDEATEEKSYFIVSFKYAEGVFCTNLAHARTLEEVEAHYKSKYEWVKVESDLPYSVEECKRRGMPIIDIGAPIPEETKQEAPAEEKPQALPAPAKTVVAAVKRIIKNDRLPGLFPLEDRYNAKMIAACDGFRLVALDGVDMPDLPHIPQQPGIEKLIVKTQGETWLEEYIDLPTIEEARAAMKMHKIKGGYRPYEALPGWWCNPEFLRDMLQALPGCKARKPLGEHAPLLLEAENGIGLLMPVRHL